MEKIKSLVKEWGWLFAVLLIVSTLSYSLIIFARIVNDSDGTWHGDIAYTGNSELIEGRWLQPYIDRARFWLSPDPLSSVTALAVFAIGFILIMDLLKIRDKRINVVSGLIFMISTSVCSTLSFRYMSLEFACAFIFAVAAFYSVVNIKKPVLAIGISACLITLYMGLYQAFLGSTAIVIVFYLLYRLFKNDEIKSLGILTGRCLLSYLAGGAMYYIIWREELWRYDTEATSYGGADAFTIGGVFTHLTETLGKPYIKFADYFLNRTVSTTMLPKFIHLSLIAAFVAASALAVIIVFKKDRVRAALMALLTLLIPFACMWFYVLTYSVSYMSMHMTISLAACLALMVCMIYIYAADIMKEKAGILNKAIWALTLVGALAAYGNHSMVQYDQMAMYMGEMSVYEIGSEVISELIADGLYDPNITYCFIGSPSNNPLFFKNDVFEKCNSYARYGDWGNVPNDNRQGWSGFFLHMKGIHLKIADNEVIDAFDEDPRVEAMPVFPVKGSVAPLDGYVVIKLAE
ncbi:MAG: glucosyltransferase domain-containing protein [Lachnospiraceae bacterium]|nr:glucosyltransferase domain-containing protein [Lachnospiraceae bacterium]